jgi:hypothetical protein
MRLDEVRVVDLGKDGIDDLVARSLEQGCGTPIAPVSGSPRESTAVCPEVTKIPLPCRITPWETLGGSELG